METAGMTVLMVDDQRDNLTLLLSTLQPQGYNIQPALSGADALKIAARIKPDLILLDVMMPEMDGFETCRRFKEDPALRDIPIIFLTARTEPNAVVDGFQAGAIDYVTKPFQQDELLMRVETQLKLRRSLVELQQKNAALEAEIAQRQVLTRERDQLAGQLSLISDEEAQRWGIEGFVGRSPTLKRILERVEQLQHSTTSVVIVGESGTGKELIARAIHFGSDRAEGPFVPVNCSAVPGELADSLFFGHVKGAFTGADRDRAGYFSLAHGGTLFLDEVGDMPLELQAKLLRALEQREVMPVGGAREQAVDVRVVSATNVDLEAAMQEGRLRQDLYYRLAGFLVEVPPLRARQEDIPLLAQHFLGLFEQETGRRTTLDAAAVERLKEQAFPGNVRELKNVIERAVLESRGGTIGPEHLHFLQVRPAPAVASAAAAQALPDFEVEEREAVRQALLETGGNVAAAARRLNMHRSRFYRPIERYELLPKG